MKLTIQKRLSQRLLKSGKKRIKFNPEMLTDIKEAITKADIRNLISGRVIIKEKKKGISRARIRKRHPGQGSRKGKKTARLKPKRVWMNKIRLQRSLIRELKEKGLIDKKTFRELYLKSKGGFFRSKAHMKLYIREKGLIIEKGVKK